jgi:hypothetical protein
VHEIFTEIIVDIIRGFLINMSFLDYFPCFIMR